MYKYKNQDIHRMILFIVELFANVKRIGVYIKQSLGHLIYDSISFQF